MNTGTRTEKGEMTILTGGMTTLKGGTTILREGMITLKGETTTGIKADRIHTVVDRIEEITIEKTNAHWRKRIPTTKGANKLKERA